MPTYQYRCTECAAELEAVQKFTDPALTQCPECSGALRKVYSAVGVVFKGSGFYATDNRTKGAAASTGADGAKSASGASTGSESGSSDSSGSGTSGASATPASGGSTPSAAPSSGGGASSGGSSSGKASGTTAPST